MAGNCTAKLWLVLLCVCLFHITPVSLYPQGPERKQVEQSKELFFNNDSQKSQTLPFDLINNLILIPIQINGSDTLRFILDTGLNTSIITELCTGETINLNYAREIQLQGLGTGNPVSAIHSYGNKIEVAGISGINQDYFVLMENVFKISNKLGTPVHGLLSFNVFNSFIVEINYDNKLITFHNPKYYKYKTKNKKYVTFPLTIHDNKPFIHIKIAFWDGTVVPIKVLLDTGASNSIWIDLNSIPGIKFPEDARKSRLGSGLSGDVKGHLARLDKVYIDRFELDDVIVCLPDSASFANTMDMDERNGSLGAEILKRFNLIIDYPNELITFSKNSKFSNKFSYNMTGIELVTPIPGKKFYTIRDIRKNSPAERAGLQIDDELISINNMNASEYSLGEIYDLFQSRQGKKIKLGVRRDGQKLKFKFELERFI